MKRHNFKKLEVWKESMDLIEMTYQITNKFSISEKFGLVSQLNRCSISIASNIAEGSSKSSSKHFAQFLEISLGSSFEWETQIIISNKLGYVAEKEFCKFGERISLIQRKLNRLIDKLKNES